MSKLEPTILLVLLALRDETRIKSYREFLGREGFQVATATDGLKCLASLRILTPDVLVIERDLPWGGGDGVLARIDEEADLPKIPVILFFTGPKRVSISGANCGPNLERLNRHLPPHELAMKIRRLVDMSPHRKGASLGQCCLQITSS